MAFQFSFSRSDRHPWLNPKEMLLVSCRRRRTHEQLTVTAVGFPVWHFFLNPSRASPAGVAGLPLAQNLCAALWTFSGAGPSTIMHEAPNLYGNYQGIPVAIPRKFFGRTRDFYLTEYIQTEKLIWISHRRVRHLRSPCQLECHPSWCRGRLACSASFPEKQRDAKTARRPGE